MRVRVRFGGRRLRGSVAGSYRYIVGGWFESSLVLSVLLLLSLLAYVLQRASCDIFEGLVSFYQALNLFLKKTTKNPATVKVGLMHRLGLIRLIRRLTLTSI